MYSCEKPSFKGIRKTVKGYVHITTADLLEQKREQGTVEKDYWNIIIIVLLY